MSLLSDCAVILLVEIGSVGITFTTIYSSSTFWWDMQQGRVVFRSGIRSGNTLATSFSLSNCSNVRDSPCGVGYILWSMGEHQWYFISTHQFVLSLLSTVTYTFPPKCYITLEYMLFLICSTVSSTSSRYVSDIFQRISGNSTTIIPRFNSMWSPSTLK